jgi:hypothetical protein
MGIGNIGRVSKKENSLNKTKNWVYSILEISYGYPKYWEGIGSIGRVSEMYKGYRK